MACLIQIRTTKGYTGWIHSTAGVRQGCPLSLTLFAIYMQELQNLLCRGLNLSPVTLLKQALSCLLFADDIVWLATTPEGLQKQVDIL